MKTRVGVFGTGYWGALAEAAVQWLPEVAVDRVWSRSDERARALASQLGCRVARTLDDIADLDVVVAGLPPGATPAVARACLEHGVRCLLEKPVSLDASQVRALAVRFDEHDLPAAVNLQGRFVPAMHAVRAAVAAGQYGRLLEVTVSALGNRGCTASPVPHSWLNRIEDGGGVAGISGPHAAESLLSLAGSGTVVFSRSWTEVPQKPDEAGVMRKCTAPDNVEILTAHANGVRGRLRLSTTARKKEETWTARCEGGTLRVGADDRAVVVENFGASTPLPSDRHDVLTSADLADHRGLQECPDGVFPALVLLVLFARGDTSVPDLHLMTSCMEILSPARAAN
ncbi:MAG: Gfo/Idh/MocA family protein [Planctomycetota bacterium]